MIKMVLLILFCIQIVHGKSAEEILSTMDKNRDIATIQYSGTMTIHAGNAVRTKNMKVTALGRQSRKAVVEFTNKEDMGTKYLMIEKNLWIYFPEEEEVLKISGHMLKEGMMGSDVSYEDALESDQLTKKYRCTVLGHEEFSGRPCAVIELSATVAAVPYYKRKMWVDTLSWVQMKEEMYAKSGKLLKVSTTLSTASIKGKNVATKVELVNRLRPDSKTVFEMQDILIDAAVDESMFTMRYLRK
ncbi:MAG: outer membrane lipoprotein-sorting protein [Chitinivibrionales bacterium]|nr:outer membrane lipoprotein-sorting protein [Chitinivibrionales bacterium]